MRRLLTECLLVLALGAGLMNPVSLSAAGELQGELRFFPAREEPVWVGQEIELYLELWSEGFSFGDQLFVLPEVPGGFLLQGDSSTIKLSESRDGVAWQGLRYTFLLYPQTAGSLEVPPFDVGFTARAGFGSEPTAYRFRTEPLSIEARLPEGARAGGLLITTTEFALEAVWDRPLPEKGPIELQAGDALTLEVRRRAVDVPGMVFAPLPGYHIKGLGIYPAAPVVNDRVNRGELIGTRTDAVTFVCESPGRYEIPERRFQWWDPDREILAERVIPAIQLDVMANPAYAAAIEPGASSVVPWRQTLKAMAAGLLVIALAWFALRPLLRRWGHRIRQRRAEFGSRRRRSGLLQPLNPRS